ncbi:TBC1 domain family member 12 [Triplophysa rosa]|uniref:TBC1 domain family member 12 n=1 Tax=Triplophysa rosa TaxID=992332 RepID=A0A9W7WMH5_TRIRA|nr:TBC1 domain family member 12 [Triplophysa rosa]KAI7804723.1 putative TBC1 domain family member 12 [Triplophysa rosa]
MEGVEDADGLGLAPSIDVNDNRETCKVRVCVSAPDNVRSGWAAEEGSVYTSGITDRDPGQTSVRNAPKESHVLLDFNPDSVFPGCRDEIINGFPEQHEVDVVYPDGGGGGRSRSGPKAAVRATGMSDSDRVTGTSELGCESAHKPDGGYLNSQLRPKSPVSFVGRDSPDIMTMPNGDAFYGHMDNTHINRMDYGHAMQSFQDRGVKVGNGGLLIVNSYNTLSQVPFGSLGGLPAPVSHVFVHQSDCVLPSRRSCEGMGRASAESSEETRHSDAASCDPDPADTLSDLSAKLSLSPLVENTSDYTEAEPSPEEEFSEGGLPLRPQSLRTNPGHMVSLSCDATPLSPGDDGYFGAEGVADECSVNTFEGGRRQSAPDSTNPEASSDLTVDTKRHGIAEFLTRSLFSWKPKESRTTASQSVPGWKLFGNIPLRDNPPKDSKIIQQEYESRAGPTVVLPPQSMRRKNLEFEPLSTTALILEDRPANLPAKSEEESQRHRQEYSEMVAGAKRRELKDAQKKKRQMKERYRQEENIANAMVIWNTEVLPNWESMRNTRRVRELWWQGVPPSVRGKVWSLAIGNELNITPELYEIFLSRAKEKWRSFSETSSVNENEDCGVSLADRESSLDLIKLDISRTFPSLYIFQKGGPYHDILHNVLGAYTCYRPDVGYVQGMSFIAAVLILNLEEADAFIAFANLLNKPCQMAFFRVDHDLMLKYFAVFEVFFEENLPRLFQHFQNNSLTPDFYLIDWIFTLYSKSLPLDVACRVWDVFCRDGEEALFRTGLGILRLYQDVLLQMDFIHSAQFLSRLPENTPAHALFSCIANTQMVSNNRRWNQVFSALMKDGLKETDRSSSSPALRS